MNKNQTDLDMGKREKIPRSRNSMSNGLEVNKQTKHSLVYMLSISQANVIQTVLSNPTILYIQKQGPLPTWLASLSELSLPKTSFLTDSDKLVLGQSQYFSYGRECWCLLQKRLFKQSHLQASQAYPRAWLHCEVILAAIPSPQLLQWAMTDRWHKTLPPCLQSRTNLVLCCASEPSRPRQAFPENASLLSFFSFPMLCPLLPHRVFFLRALY